MAQGLLWLGLVLLATLQAQVQGSSGSLIPAPALNKIPLQPDFKEEQVRGLEGQRQGGPGAESYGASKGGISFSSACPRVP